MKYLPEINIPASVLNLAITDISNEEGYRSKPYNDTLGNITIGFGYNLSARGLGYDWAISQVQEDISYFYNQLKNTFDWYIKLNEVRQIVLIDMAFMGWKKFLTFKNFFHELSVLDFKKAADEMENSLWADELPNRAKRCVQRMRTGIY